MYVASVNEQRLTFEVLGVWRRNLVMQDRKTGTVWQQATGKALWGPLKGARLELLGGEQTSWADWLKRHPETAVSVEPTNPPKGILSFEKVEYLLDLFTPSYKTPGLNPNDNRLPSHEEVGGILLNGIARAYPLSVLQTVNTVNDTVGSVPLTICYDPHADKIAAYHLDENGRPDPTQPLPVQRQYWLGWSEFHPETTIFMRDSL